MVRRVTVLWDYPQEHLVVIKDEKACFLVIFETILPLLCCSLDTLIMKDSRAWNSMINLLIDSRICQKYRILQSVRQRCNNYLELSKEMFWGKRCSLIDHALLESSSWYGLTKFLNLFFRSIHHVLVIYVLKIEENHLFSLLSWKFSYTLRTTIP